MYALGTAGTPEEEQIGHGFWDLVCTTPPGTGDFFGIEMFVFDDGTIHVMEMGPVDPGWVGTIAGGTRIYAGASGEYFAYRTGWSVV